MAVCLDALVKYPTSYKEDMEILAKDDIDHKLPINERNCIILRKGEKKILLYMIEMAEKISHLLAENMTVKDAKKIINNIPDLAI